MFRNSTDIQSYERLDINKVFSFRLDTEKSANFHNSIFSQVRSFDKEKVVVESLTTIYNLVDHLQQRTNISKVWESKCVHM